MGKRRNPLWFRIPEHAESPALVSPAIGFERIVARPSDSFHMQVGVFDSADARLLRAGIVVAIRRRDDGPGEWYVSAPAWPGLPEEATTAVDASGELPESVRGKLALFLRHEPLQPFATMECERREYLLRGPEGVVAATIRDDVVSIVRDGQLTSREREITVRPVGGFSAQQREFVRSAFAAVDGEELGRLPTLAERIGPPASGLGVFREPAGFRKDMTLEEFVSEVFLGHATRLLHAELTDDEVVARGELAHLIDDLRGLSAVLAPQWREQMELDARTLASGPTDGRAEVMMRLMEGLTGAIRAPQLGDHASEPARAILSSHIGRQLTIMLDRCRALEPDGPDEAWSAVLRQAEYVELAALLLEPLFRKQVGRVRRALAEVIVVLRMSVRPPADIELVGMSPEEAFQLGRDVEHAQWSVDRARRHFLDHLPEYVSVGRKTLDKMAKKLR